MKAMGHEKAAPPGTAPERASAGEGFLHTILYCHHYSQIGGGETSLLELFRAIDRKRFRPLLAAPEEGPFPEAARALGVEVLPMAFGPLRRVDLLLRNARRLARIARERGASLLHANGPATNIPAALAARLSGLPIVWHARTLPGPGEMDLDRALSPLASLIIANSEAVRARFRRRDRPMEKCLTIINGVDIERFHPSVPGEEVREHLGIGAECVLAGVVGRISPVKGLLTYVEAASALLSRQPELRFLIIGGGLFPGERAFEGELRAHVSRLGLERKVLFTGHQRDVCPFMAALDICVVSSDQEACGRVLFEAMAMAKPLVGTNTGGTPEIVAEGETGLLVPPRDAASLAAAIGRLAADASLRHRMGAAGRRRVEACFTLEANARQTEAAYERLIGRRAGDG